MVVLKDRLKIVYLDRENVLWVRGVNASKLVNVFLSGLRCRFPVVGRGDSVEIVSFVEGLFRKSK